MDVKAKERMLKYRWLVLGIVCLAYFLVYFHRTTGGAISSELQDYYGVGAAAVALLASAYLYAYTLMQIPSGILSDKVGPRRSVTIFVLIIAIGSLVSAYSANTGDFNLMVAGKFIIGIGAAVVSIPAMKIMAVWFRTDEFGTMNGILLMVGNIGGIAAATPMIIMMDSLGLEYTYIVLAAVTAVISACCWLIVRDHPEDMGFPSIEEIEAEDGYKHVDRNAEESIPVREALRMIFSDVRGFWPLAIWFFIMYGSIMVWQASQAGTYYQVAYGFSLHEAGLMVTMVGVGMLVGAPCMGLLSDRVFHSRRRVIVFGTICYLMVWLFIWATCGTDILQVFWFQAIVNFLLGFFMAVFVDAYAQVKELFPISMSGMSTATLNLFPFAGGALLVTLSGFLVSDSTVAQFQDLWTILVVLLVAATVSIIISRENADAMERWARAVPVCHI
jgi:sugar phosphate permease